MAMTKEYQYRLKIKGALRLYGAELSAVIGKSFGFYPKINYLTVFKG